MDTASSTCEKSVRASRQNAAEALASLAFSESFSWPEETDAQRRSAVVAAAVRKWMVSLSFEAKIAVRSCKRMLQTRNVRGLRLEGRTLYGGPDCNEVGQTAQDEATDASSVFFWFASARGSRRPEDALVRLSCRQSSNRVCLCGYELAGDRNILVYRVEELRAEAQGYGRQPQDGACNKTNQGNEVALWRV